VVLVVCVGQVVCSLVCCGQRSAPQTEHLNVAGFWQYLHCIRALAPLCLCSLDPSLIYRLNFWLWFVPPFGCCLSGGVVCEEFIWGVRCLTCGEMFRKRGTDKRFFLE
jgi:hypothetical protein